MPYIQWGQIKSYPKNFIFRHVLLANFFSFFFFISPMLIIPTTLSFCLTFLRRTLNFYLHRKTTPRGLLVIFCQKLAFIDLIQTRGVGDGLSYRILSLWNINDFNGHQWPLPSCLVLIFHYPTVMASRISFQHHIHLPVSETPY